MRKPIQLTGPPITLEQLGALSGMSKARQRAILKIVQRVVGPESKSGNPVRESPVNKRRAKAKAVAAS